MFPWPPFINIGIKLAASRWRVLSDSTWRRALTVYNKSTIKKGVTRWYFQFMTGGKYHRGGGYLTKREAQGAEAQERRLSSAHPDMVFGDLAEKYLTYVLDRKQSKRWYLEKRNFFKNRCVHWFRERIDTIDRADIEGFILERSKSSPYMANKELKFLKAMFNYAVSQGLLPGNPCSGIEKVSVEKRVRHFPSMADFNKLLLVAGPIEQRMLILMFTTAARQNEILDLKWRDIDKEAIILRTRKHKGGAIREDRIPIGPKAREAIDWLRSHCPGGPEDYIFLNRRTSTRYDRRPKLMRSLCLKAGVKLFGFHDIRALAASKLSDEGTPIKYISSRLRHLKTSTTEIYLHAIEEGERRAASVLEGALA